MLVDVWPLGLLLLLRFLGVLVKSLIFTRPPFSESVILLLVELRCYLNEYSFSGLCVLRKKEQCNHITEKAKRI